VTFTQQRAKFAINLPGKHDFLFKSYRLKQQDNAVVSLDRGIADVSTWQGEGALIMCRSPNIYGRLFSVTLVFPLIGCDLAPLDTTPPDVVVPASFASSSGPALREAATRVWWAALGDPILDDFVATGLSQNFDIRTALERIEAASAAARRAGVPEQLDGAATGDLRRRRNANGNVGNDGTVSANALYVFDIFGEFRSSQDQATAQLEVAELDVGVVRLAFLADVVDSYLNARFNQNAAAITRQSIASRRQTLDFVQQRFDAGEATRLELAQAQSLLATAQASLPSFEANFRVNVFRIAALIDQPPAEILARMSAGRAQPRPRGSMETGMPVDLLRNRPDVRRAEREFVAAAEGVGVAEAQLYPSLRLTGDVTVGDLPTVWSFGPSITVPLLSLPLRIANRDIALSRAREAELIYRQAVVQAIEDTEAAYSLTQFQRRQVNSFEIATRASGEVLELSKVSYEQGSITIIDLLDAERNVLSDRLDLARAVRDWSGSWVQLQVSTGKGWLAADDTLVVASQ